MNTANSQLPFLWPLVPVSKVRLAVVSGPDLGTVLGLLAKLGRLLWLGAPAARRRLHRRHRLVVRRLGGGD